MPTAATTLSIGDSIVSIAPSSSRSGTPPQDISLQRPALPWTDLPCQGTILFNAIVGRSFVLTNSVLEAPIENLTLDSSRTSAFSRSEFTFRSPVSGLLATFSDGRDTITFLDAVTGSTIQTDATPSGWNGGADRLVASGGLFDTTVRTGAGRDTLLFSKEVFDSTIDTGTGNDQITLTPGSIVSNTSFSLGAGNDTLTFQGGALANDGKSLISLGTGADTLIAGPGSFVAGYTIDLGGADGAIDQVQFQGALDPSNAIRITGASLGDLLVIGAGSFTGTYSYDGSSFANGSDTLTWLT